MARPRIGTMVLVTHTSFPNQHRVGFVRNVVNDNTVDIDILNGPVGVVFVQNVPRSEKGNNIGIAWHWREHH